MVEGVEFKGVGVVKGFSMGLWVEKWGLGI